MYYKVKRNIINGLLDTVVVINLHEQCGYSHRGNFLFFHYYLKKAYALKRIRVKEKHYIDALFSCKIG